MGGLFPKNLFIRNSLAISATIFTLVIILPIVLLTSGLLVTIRALLSWYKNRWKPELGNILSRSNSIFASDNPYKNPILNVSCFMVMDGHMSMETLLHVVGIAHKRFEDEGIYPELQEELSSWMGFPVWKKIENYNIKDYIKMLDSKYLGGSEIVTEENISEISFKLTKEPFPAHTSPWDLHICHQVKISGREGRPTTVIFYRFHHCLGDALSFIQYFSRVLQGPDVVNGFVNKVAKSVVRVRRNTLQKIWYAVSYPFLGVYELIMHYIDVWDSNEWLNLSTPVRKDFNYLTVAKIPTDQVKEMRRVQGDVKFYSILLAALSGGLKKYMTKNKVPVPESMSCLVSVPVPNKEPKLSNNLTSIIYTMPLRYNKRRDAVHCIEQQSIDLKSSRVPVLMLGIYAFLGLMPNFMNVKWIFTTAASSNFPGFDTPLRFHNYTLLDLQATASINSSCGIYYWCSGYAGTLQVSLGVSKDIMKSKEEIKECSEFIAQEFEAMKNPANTDIITKAFVFQKSE